VNVAKKKITPDNTSALSTTPVDPKVGSAAAPKKRRAPARKTQPLATVATAANGGNGKTQPAAGNGKTQPTDDEIAVAAYYRHLNRGGTHGDQFNDWVEAERELRERRR
jgi:hypothetical protein